MSKKTIQCKTCGKEIAGSAKSCPSCGAKNKKPFFKKPIFWIAIIIVIAIIAAIGNSKSEPEIDYSKPDFVVTADEIMNEYKENSVAAQEKYSGKIISVTGTVSNISESTVRLSGSNDENFLTNVVLNVAPGQNDVIMSISTDMKITAVGKCSSTDFFNDIKIDKAKIDTEGIEIKPAESTAEQKQPDEIIEISIDDLLEKYEDNTVAADSEYKDKTLKVSGKIYSVEDGYIKLEGSDSWELRMVYAYYNNDQDVTALKKGSNVTVIGVCKGEELFGNIELKKCIIE